MEANQTAQELQAARELIGSFESELEQALSENKHMQLDHHARQTENARLRLEYGVRTKLLENNLQELSAHIEVLEQRLQEANMAVPALQLTPIEKSAIDMEQPPASNQPPQNNQPRVAEPAGKRGDVLRFRAKR